MEELDRIYACGIRAVCVESRHHPDYAGPGWWSDMDLIMRFARDHAMEVWLLDDDRFPTGHCNGIFADGSNRQSVRFLTIHNTDVCGPRTPGYMLVKSLLEEDDELVGVVACRRADPDNTDLIYESAVDVTGYVRDGWLCWDVPEGLWRIMVLRTTRRGNGKLDYFNIIDSASVRLLLDEVYEPHYAHYGSDFGKTFMGFFSDEPEFSNLPGFRFQARLGEDMPFIPWSGELQQRLQTRWGEHFLRNLPALWHDAGEVTPHLRYEYMDEVTAQLSVSFSGQIRDWCDAHGVIHIGHIVEDDNSHGRLGCSTGHYFRSIGEMRMAGVDVVTQQIMPGMDQGEHQWVASSRDGEFFHYGLAKLASSLAHIDAKKKGDSMCEIFGAFGWQEGIGLMHWLTDHMISRGINHFTPHAFSMKPYPDPDCPPHFYAHGRQPQYRHFDCLMNYMNRLSHLFSGGKYPAQIAVLYHADAEWAGRAMLYQKPVRVLQQHQMDCDVIPADMLREDNSYGAVFGDGIRVAGQHYTILLIPESDYIPLSVARFVLNEHTGVHCLLVGQRPTGICEQTSEEAELIRKLQRIESVSLNHLPERMRELHTPLVQTDREERKLCTYPYLGEDGCRYLFCFNESIREAVRCRLKIACGMPGGTLLEYDAQHNRCMQADCVRRDGEMIMELSLLPGESMVLVIDPEAAEKERAGKPCSGTPFRTCSSGHLSPKLQQSEKPCGRTPSAALQTGAWRIFSQEVREDSWRPLCEVEESQPLPDITKWVIQESFCGTLAYETDITLNREQAGRYLMRMEEPVDCADLYVNGICTDRGMGVPLKLELPLQEGINVIRLELPLTPVFRDGDPWSCLTVLPQAGLVRRPAIFKEALISSVLP